VRAVLLDRNFLSAAALGAGCQFLMSYLMVATPLAVVGCGLTASTAAMVIQWHLVSMYAPSYLLNYTPLGRRTPVIVGTGCLALVACVAVLASGNAATTFVAGLVLLGVGWNFTNVGATVMLATSIPAADEHTAQGANELALWSASAAGSALSGAVYASHAWQGVLATAFVAATVLSVAMLGAMAAARVRRPVA